jgi:tetratricopeptide (TPR) repeat protein
MQRLSHTVRSTSVIGMLALPVALAFALPSCSPGAPPPVSRATLTSADLSKEYAKDSARSIRSGQWENALELADRSVAFEPSSAWAHYDRAVALERLMRTDDAIAAYRLAHSLFAGTDARGRSIALYGVARALDDAGRCTDAATAYGQFATYVERSDAAAATLARSYARECGQAHLRGGEATASEMSSAVVDGHYERALRRADVAAAMTTTNDAAGAGPASPWVEYNRGVALSELGRTDEAVRAFASAEAAFAASAKDGARSASKTKDDRWGTSIAVYGRARALDNAGRCAEASKAYREYAMLAPAPDQAAVALATSKKCKAITGGAVIRTR